MDWHTVHEASHVKESYTLCDTESNRFEAKVSWDSDLKTWKWDAVVFDHPDDAYSHPAEAKSNSSLASDPEDGMKQATDWLEAVMAVAIQAEKEKRMTRQQMLALWIGIAVVCLMALFPPWVIEVEEGGSKMILERPGYGFIGHPPESTGYSLQAYVDTRTLAIQILPAVLITGAVILTLRWRKP